MLQHKFDFFCPFFRPLRRGRLQGLDFLNTIYCAHKPASFWRENMIAVVILPRVLARIETFRFKDENDYEYEILLNDFSLILKL